VFVQQPLEGSSGYDNAGPLTPVGRVEPANAAAGGAGGATFSFVDPEHGWLLIPRESLLTTTDGKTWTALDMAPL
jgi:photosystem II stability/assembly factor-like uncharacterized protein